MNRRLAVPLFAVALLLSVALGACSGRPAVEPPPADLGVVAGRVFKGAVKDAAVTVYRLEGTKRGAIAGTATTDADGAFRVAVGTATGPFLVVATAGSFTDEATGVSVQVNSAELTALIPTFDVETKLEAVRVTPVSHLAAGLALYWVDAEGKALAAADTEAWLHLNAHFGALDWRTQTPTDVTTAAGATLDEPTKEGLLLAALSMEARLIAEQAGLTPGGRVNPLSLTAALYDDVTADGFFDGIGRTGRLVLPQGGAVADAGPSATLLDGQTARTSLAQGIAKFLSSDRNVTHVSLADVQQLINAIATNDDARIFRGTSGPADVEPPVITFIKPATDMAGVRGTVELEVQALDGVAVKSFVFTAPASIVGTVANVSPDAKTARLVTTLDVSALADGPVALTVRAVDTSNNEATKTLTLIVSNRGPNITVSSPSDGAHVSGVTAISASATAQAGSIAKLELRMAPAGVGPDTLPAADSFGATWNSLVAPEGLVTLTFHAEDTLGGIADTSVTVTVDNVPFGTVTTTATLGAPVGGLSVKLVAIDDATGQPVMGRAGGAILGQTSAGTTTDPSTGAVTFTLSQENYDGPVQLVASGTAASYVDPTSDLDAGAATNIALPTSFTLTSYVRRYKTGDTLNVPLTGWTTLADDAVLAYAQGRNPSSPDAGTLSNALTVVEPLFPAHVSRPNAWPLRTVFPISLTTSSQSLRDVVYAALPDVGLNQLARDTAVDVGLTPGTGYALPQLLTSLRQDISDGQFDGLSGSLQLATGGTTPYVFDPNTSRFKLAISMDRFIRSSANKTGLTRADLQTQSIYDNVAGDRSVLYPSTAAPIPFDNVPPTVAWTITFANGGQMALPPFALGSTKLLAGVVAIQADATDSSGVQSISVDLGGAPLSPAMGSSNSRFKSSFDSTTQPDGTFTLTAMACDRLANCGTSTYVFDTDNTVPTVSPTKPQPGFYSAAFDIEALASDNTRLATFDVLPSTSATGLADQDAQLNRVYAPATSWSLASSAADGPLAITFQACDVVRNCATGTATPTIDRTPPSVTITSTVPQYTNQGGLNLAISASDGPGAGVRRVLVSRNGDAPVPATLVGAQWTSSLLLVNGLNTIVVWAEDLALPTNSGQGRTAPYQQSATVLLDTAPPAFNFVSFPAYQSETALNFQRQANGQPVMPVVYVYQSAAKVDISPDATTVVKAASRLSWGPTTPTGAELETTNARNVPFMQTAVGYNPSTDSPITTARFRFTTASGTTNWTNAIPAARTSLNTLYFDLPISLETLPHLTSWSGTRTFYLELNMSDAAGNTWTLSTGATGTPKTFTVVPPPVAIIRDTGYTSRGDAKSIYNYRLANQTYDDFFDTNNANFAGDNYARHSRFTVFNPSDAPVAISVRVAGSSVNGTQRETWSNVNYIVAGAPGDTFVNDGFTWRVGPYWDSRAGSNFAASCTNDPQFTSPCGVGSKGTHYPAHVNGSGSQWTCLPYPLSITQQWSTPGLGALGVFRVFKNAVTAPTGVESTAADTVTTGFVVPGATGTTPGTLAVYQASPRPTRGSAPALLYGSNPYDAASRFQYWRGDYWVPVGDGYSCNISRPDLTTEAYAARRWYQQLNDATSSFGTIGAIFGTSGVTAAAPYTLIGGFADYVTDTTSINFAH